MFFSIAILNGSAANSGYYTYTIANGQATITNCNKTISGDITIPSTLGGYPVTKIGYDVFHDCPNLTSLVIPDTVISIDTNAIWGCENLKSLTIGENVAEIEDNVFCGLYALETINWNAKDLTYLIDRYDDNYVFDGAGKNGNGITIVFGDSVTSIPANAFTPEDEDAKIAKIIMGKNIKRIGKNAFNYRNAYAVYIDSLNSYFSIDFENAKSYPTYSAEKLYINNILATELNIPNGVMHISEGVIGHNNTHITKITIPQSVTSIDENAFLYCPQLKEINVANGNKDYSSVSGILFNKQQTELISLSNKNELTNYIVPIGVNTIKRYAFGYCSNLKTVTLPPSIKTIEEYSFVSCNQLKEFRFQGTKSEFSIDAGQDYTNSVYYKAKKVYLKCNILFNDTHGNKIGNKTQDISETVDISAITIPKGYALKLYTDKELTQEYSLDTPISEDLILYVDFIKINNLEISGVQKADIGQNNILQSVIFATDKTAKNLIVTVKYPDILILNEVRSKDFDIVQNKYSTNGYTYLDLECAYKNGNIPTNKTLNPFNLVFDISENAKPNDVITIEFDSEPFLADENGNTYDFDSVGSAQITVNPILVQGIVINGENEIHSAAQYTATVLPEKATNKEIEWSVDNTEIASISEDGILTPIKSGDVKITATAKDGSNVFGEKAVSVKVYAEISSLKSNIGVWNKSFEPTGREYIIYVPKDTATVRFTATHNGTLKAGTATIYNEREKAISLSDDETDIIFTYSCTGYTDSVYTVKIVRFEGTKTTVSEDGKTFDVKPVNVAVGSTVVLALYDNGNFVGMKSGKYNGTDIQFTTDNAYTNAKVMVWKSLENMKPVCEAEVVK